MSATTILVLVTVWWFGFAAGIAIGYYHGRKRLNKLTK